MNRRGRSILVGVLAISAARASSLAVFHAAAPASQTSNSQTSPNPATPTPATAPAATSAAAISSSLINPPNTALASQPGESTTTVATTLPATTQSTFDRAIDLTSTTFVDVHVRNATFPIVAEAVIHGAHLSLNVDPSHEPPLEQQERRDFDADHQPLVLAMMNACDAFGVDILRNPVTGSWDFNKRLPPPTSGPAPAAPPKPDHFARAPVYVHGPFAVYARSITIMHSVDPLPPGQDTSTDASPTVENMTLSFAICAEPRVAIFERAFVPVMETCTDDRGQSLLRNPILHGPPSKISVNGRELLTVPAIANIPTAGAKRLTHVAGYLPVSVVSREAPLQFASPLQGSWRALNLHSFRAAIGGFADLADGEEEALIEVYRDSAPPDQWAARLQMLEHVHLPHVYDNQGRELRTISLLGGAVTGDGRTLLRLHCRRQDLDGNIIAGLPVRWDWHVPLESTELRIPFSFDNLPLPAD